MNKNVLIATLFLLLPLVGMSQQGVRYWEKGPLTWNDFSVVNKSIGAEHSYLEFGLDVVYRKQELESGSIMVNTAVAYANKEMSWVDANFRTPAQLRYNQVVFNIAELHRRRLQVVVDTGGAVNMDYYMRLLTHEVDSFCRLSNYGNDTAEVLWWEQEIRRQMDSITPLMVEKHTLANKVEGMRPDGSFGMSMGLGTKFFFGDIYHLFAPSGGFYFDMYGGGGRHVFTCGFYIGGGRCKPDSIMTVDTSNTLYWNDKIMTIDLHVDYGYSVVSNRRLTLTPFVGYGLQGVYYSTTDEGAGGGPSEGCWRLGVDAQYDFTQTQSTGRFSTDLYGVALQTKVYVSYDRFRSIVDTPRGLTLNAQVGIGFRYREMRILRPAVKKEATTSTLGRRIILR